MPRFLCLCALLLLAGTAQAEKNLLRPPGTTRYMAMVRELNALRKYDRTQGGGRMQLVSIGHSVKGRDLWMVTLHEPAPPPSIPGESEGAKKVFYLCRQHGHEPASTEAALALITLLVKADRDSPLDEDLKNVTVFIVPMANPDGAEAFLRRNAHNVDINRDWLRRTQPETQALYRTILKIHPDLMTDQHELYPDDTRPDFTETAAPGSGATLRVTAACEETQNALHGALLAEGFMHVSHWITDTHPARLAHRYNSVVAGIPTILFETNRLAGSGRTVALRAAAQEQFMEDVLRDEGGEHGRLLAEAAAWQAAHLKDTDTKPASPASPQGGE